jgi:limonene 1,2-monooxygenase
MLGLEPTRQREMMDEGLGVIIRLMTENEPITYETDWFKLNEASLQLKPYQRPTMPMAVASTLSPAGMTCAGKHGIGVLSVASYAPDGLAALQRQWEFCEEAAGKAGREAPDRHGWRVVMPFHLADSREEAIKDIEEGVLRWNNEYYVGTLGAPMRMPAENGRAMAEQLIQFGAFIGTPEDAIEGIQKLLDMSGGFGCFLGLAHDWADRQKTLRSFELMARYVMPRFQDTMTWIDRSQQWTQGNKQKLMEGARAGVFKAVVDAGATADLAKTIQQGASVIAPQTEGVKEFAEQAAKATEKAETAGS